MHKKDYNNLKLRHWNIKIGKKSNCNSHNSVFPSDSSKLSWNIKSHGRKKSTLRSEKIRMKIAQRDSPQKKKAQQWNKTF